MAIKLRTKQSSFQPNWTRAEGGLGLNVQYNEYVPFIHVFCKNISQKIT